MIFKEWSIIWKKWNPSATQPCLVYMRVHCAGTTEIPGRLIWSRVYAALLNDLN